MRILATALTPLRPPSPITASHHSTPNSSSPLPSDTEPFSLNSGDDSSSERRRSSTSISYRAPTATNGERDHLLPSAHPTTNGSPPTAPSLPTSASAASSTQPRADRFRGAAILLITVLVLLVLTLHQRLSPSVAYVRTPPATSHHHKPHTHDHSPSHTHTTSPDAAVDASALFDEGNDVTVLYHPVIVNALPYTSPPLDSTATTVHLHGRYSDATTFLYPLCTFSRACATPSELLLTVASNYSVWVYYAAVLPYCPDVLYKRLEVCGCFHSGWRVGLLPWRGVLGDGERAEGERVGRGMVERQFGGLADWTRGWEQVGPARTRPTVEELRDMQWVQPEPDSAPTSWLDRARSLLAATLSFTTRNPTPSLYPDPFATPPLSTPPTLPTNHSHTSPPPSPANLTLHYYDSHYYSIQKWVEHHHIAHWAQKLLVAYAALSHYQHACRHRYRRLALDGQLQWLTPLVHRPRLEATAAGVAEYVDVLGRVGEVREVVEGEVWEAGVWELECLEPVVGMVFQDTYGPVSEHMQHILEVTVEALQDSVGAVDDEATHHIHTHSSTTTTQPPHIQHLYPGADGPATTPPPPFSTANTLYTGALFRQYPDRYNHRPRDLPPPTNQSTLSCFRRLTFSPLYGTFARSAYDLHGWRERAMRHYGIDRHQPHYSRSIPITLLPAANTTLGSPYLPHPLTPLPPTARVDHALLSTLALMTCPPPNTVLITRPDRAVANLQAVLDRLRERFGLDVRVVSVDGRTASAEQARLFASAGILLSAHSSQMVNVLYSGSNSVMIEMVAEFYNIDFFNYARSVGVRFLYALGGSVVGWVDPGEGMSTCVKELKERCAGGDGYCVESVARVGCAEKRYFPNKHKAFEADVDAVERAVREGLRHLMHTCHGRWGNAYLAVRS